MSKRHFYNFKDTINSYIKTNNNVIIFPSSSSTDENTCHNISNDSFHLHLTFFSFAPTANIRFASLKTSQDYCGPVSSLMEEWLRTFQRSQASQAHSLNALLKQHDGAT